MKQYNNNFLLKLAQTDKTFFIYNFKIASRYMNNVGNFPSLIFHIQPNQRILLGEKLDEYSTQIIEDWESMIEGRLKKDIVILYRDPIKRYATSILQDVYGWVGHHDSDLHIYPILKTFGYTEDEIDMLYKGDNSISSHDIDKDSGIDYTILENMVISLCKSYIVTTIRNSSINQNHNNPHLLPLVQLLTTSNIDKNKLIMIDIDEDKTALESYFKKIEILNDSTISEETHKNLKAGNHTSRLSKIHEIINQENINNRILDSLIGETTSYNILKHIHKSL